MVEELIADVVASVNDPAFVLLQRISVYKFRVLLRDELQQVANIDVLSSVPCLSGDFWPWFGIFFVPYYKYCF